MTPEAERELMATLRDMSRQLRAAQVEIEELSEDRDALAAELERLRTRPDRFPRATAAAAHATRLADAYQAARDRENLRESPRDPRRALLALLLAEVL